MERLCIQVGWVVTVVLVHLDRWVGTPHLGYPAIHRHHKPAVTVQPHPCIIIYLCVYNTPLAYVTHNDVGNL